MPPGPAAGRVIPGSVVPAALLAMAQAAVRLTSGLPCPPCNPPQDLVLCTLRFAVGVANAVLFGGGCP